MDMGAYELQNPTSLLSYAWLQQYGLPTDGTADYGDGDQDCMNNCQEWMAGTNPTNCLSLLRMLVPSNTVSGVTVNWQSVGGKTYYLMRSTNLLLQPALVPLQSNLLGQGDVTSFTDISATDPGAYYYRVGIQQ